MRLPITPNPTNPKLAILYSVRAGKTNLYVGFYVAMNRFVSPWDTMASQIDELDTRRLRRPLRLNAGNDWHAICIRPEQDATAECRITFLAVVLSAAQLGRRRWPATFAASAAPCPRHRRPRIWNRMSFRTRKTWTHACDLLQIYLDTAPASPDDESGRRSVRLQHILYLVEHHPEAAASASRAAYVYRDKGPYANVADHEAVRDQWLAAVQGHPKNMAVT